MQKTQMETTIREILKKAGLETAFDTADEFHLKVENKHYMDLVIERHGRRVSVAHYFQQNGDAMRDPEIEFILATWLPVWIQQDPVGMFTVAISFSDDGKPRIHKTMLADLTRFAAKWARNIKAQKFAERGTFTSLTHKVELDDVRLVSLAKSMTELQTLVEKLANPTEAEATPDAHLEMMHEDRVSGSEGEPEPYEPSPYDGTYSEK